MWFLIASALAYEPHVAGGFGPAVIAQGSNLLATPAVGVAGALEVTELIVPVPWLGVGVDTVIGYYPSRCDTCDGYPVLRQGIGPAFRTKGGLGLLHVGARYAIGTISLQRQSKVRPFLKSVATLPAGPIDFRVAVWGEGLPTEVGLSLEVGWWLQDGRFYMSRDAMRKHAASKRPPNAPKVEVVPEPAPEAQPAPAPEPEPEPNAWGDLVKPGEEAEPKPAEPQP